MTLDESRQIVSILETEGFKRVSEYLQKKHKIAYTESKQALQDINYHNGVRKVIIATSEMNLIDEIFKMIDEAKQNVVKNSSKEK